ncbi:MAG: MBL fold metallo-hydrolase [Dysgonamonadaceae bacterium]
MKIKTFQFNPLGVNTYVLSDENGISVVIDPSCFYHDEKELLLNYILDNNLKISHLLSTHLHFDHIFGNNLIKEQFNLLPEANKDDEYLINMFTDQLQQFGFISYSESTPQIGTYLNENDIINFGNINLKVIAVPGHSPGSIVFYNEINRCAFVGDVLFRGGIGRTDLEGGNYDLLIQGIKTKLFTLPNETVIYPGHGPQTTIGEEKKYNPFLY